MFLKKKSAILAILAVIIMALSAHAQEVKKISKDDLKAKLTSPDVLVLDARSDRDWASSEWKIQGASRVEPSKVDEWKVKYAKDKTLVIYCA